MTTTFQEVFDEYMDNLFVDGKSEHTIRAYKEAILAFKTYFEIENIDEVDALTKSDIDKYKSNLNKTLKASSVNAHIRNISPFLNWLKEYDYSKTVPTSGVRFVKEPKKLPVFLTDDEWNSVIAAAKRLKDKAMISLMLATGVRRSEVCNIKLSDIKDGHILIHGKGNKERRLPIESSTLDILNTYISKRKTTSEYLFYSNKCRNENNQDGKITGQAVNDTVRRVCRLAGFSEERINEITAHKLRHSTCTRLVDQGVSLVVIQKAMGHELYETTLRYAHASDNALESAMLNIMEKKSNG